MRVALCLSGQPRSFVRGYDYHKKNLLDHYDVDVFMHTWPNYTTNPYAQILNLYKDGGKHVQILANVDPYMEDREAFAKKINELYTRVPNSEFPAINTWLMWYSIHESIEQAYLHDDYDVIVRSRFDYALNIRPPLELTVVNRVYVPSDRMTQNHDFCADMFAWGTPNVMMKYAQTFDNLYNHYEAGVTMIGEDMLARQLKEHGLVGKNMVYVEMQNPFPPGPYNGNWHSLIRDDFTDWNQLR